jgi:glycosyltransferase involved in cell wall biosynthesis
MKRALVISYFFPPYNRVGALRVSKMTRYLACHGWESTVVTAATDDVPADLDLEIPGDRIRRIDQSVDILKLPRRIVARRDDTGWRQSASAPRRANVLWKLAILYRNLVCFPDAQIGWYRPAVRAGLAAIDELKPSIIFSSSLPNTTHLVASSLAKRTGVPWVAEFRDLWTDNHNFRRVAGLRAAERLLERRTLSRASALVTVSDVWAETLRRRFDNPVHVIPNGFDSTDYPAAGDRVAPGRRFSLVYTGMFYQSRQNAEPIVAAIAALARAGEITPESFQLRLVGHYLHSVMGAADRAGILPFVRLDAPVSHRESLRTQTEATALLFFDWFTGEKGWYSAKIYEYLGARRRILAIGPGETVVSALIEKSGVGVTAGTSERAAEVLGGWVREHSAAGELPCSGEPSVLERFQRQRLAADMAALFDRYGH